MEQKLKTKLLLATLIIAVAHFNAFSQVDITEQTDPQLRSKLTP